MKILAHVRAVSGALLNRVGLNRELDDEIGSHIQIHADDLERSGLSRAEAERQARLAFGGRERFKEECRDMVGISFLESLAQDIRFGLRLMRKNPGFTAVAVLTLALGIGANVAIFTLVEGILLRSLPVANPSQLYRVGDRADCCYWDTFQNPDGDFDIFSYDLFQRFRESAPEFEQLAAVEAGGAAFDVRSGALPVKRLRAEYVSGNYFSALGVSAFAGRLFIESDDVAEAPPAIVLSYQDWQANFGGDPSIIGSTVNVEGHPFTVVGIAPPGFFGDRVVPSPPDFWLPLANEPVLAGANSYLLNPDEDWLYAIGRVRPKTNLAALQSKLSIVLRQWLASRPGYTDRGGASQIPKQHVVLATAGGGIQKLQQQTGAGLRLLMVLSIVILLIACGNIANLLLARGAARRADIAIRIALGAKRARLLRQMLTESVLLSLLGGAAGVAVAFVISHMLIALAFPHSPNIPVNAGPSPTVLAFAIIVSLCTAMLFGVTPAWISSRAHAAEALRGSGRVVRDASSLPQRALVVLQVALSVLLVAGALVTARSLRNLEHQSLGIATANRYVTLIDPQGAGYTADRLPGLYRQIESAFSALPAATHLSFARYTPLGGNTWGDCVLREGYPPPRVGEKCFSAWDRVSPQFLDSIGVPIVRGRGLSDADVTGTGNVAVVNEAFVRQFFPNEDPIGRHFGTFPVKYAGAFEIVGVFADFKMSNPRSEVQPLFLRPLAQQFTGYTEPGMQAAEVASMYAGSVIFDFAQQQENPEGLVRGMMARIDPNLNVFGFQTYDAQVAANFNQERLIASLTTGFGILALMLAAVGIYGVMSYSVRTRINEIGIRMALGAARANVVLMILRETLALSAIGLCVGIPLVFAAARLAGSELAGLLFGVSATSGGFVVLACAVLAASATLAGYLPAWRASCVEPMVALRHE